MREGCCSTVCSFVLGTYTLEKTVPPPPPPAIPPRVGISVGIRVNGDMDESGGGGGV